MTTQNLKLRVKSSIPASITGSNGITVTKTNGNYNVAPTSGVFGDVTGPGLSAPVVGKVAVFLDGRNIGAAAFDSSDVEAIKSAGAGMLVKTDAVDPQVYAGRTLTGTAGEITVTNGTGVSGDPTLSLPATIVATGKTVTNATLSAPTITGALDIQNSYSLSGELTPAQITANQNDYQPTNFGTHSVIRLSSDADRQITGILGGPEGRIVHLLNVGSFNILLKDASGSSTAANRFSFGDDAMIYPNRSVTLFYDSIASRWRIVAGHIKRNIIDFREYGAKGDGATDDTAAIQRMLTAEPSNVWLDGGGQTYYVSSALTNAAGQVFQKIKNARFTVAGDASFLSVPTGLSSFFEMEDVYIAATAHTTFGRALIDISRMSQFTFRRVWTVGVDGKTLCFQGNGTAPSSPYYGTWDSCYAGNFFNWIRAEDSATVDLGVNSNHVISGRVQPGTGNTAIYLGQNSQNFDVQTISIESAGGTGIDMRGQGHTVGKGVRFEGLTTAVNVQADATNYEIAARYYSSCTNNIAFASDAARRNGLVTYDPDRAGAFSAPKAIYAGVGGGEAEVIVSGRVNTNLTTASNTSTTETDLMSYTLPANSLNATGQILRITAWGTIANSANAKSIKVYFGGSVIATLIPTTSSANNWRAVAEIAVTGSNAQKYNGAITQAGAATLQAATNGALTVTATASIIIKVTGQGGASTEVTFLGSIIEFV